MTPSEFILALIFSPQTSAGRLWITEARYDSSGRLTYFGIAKRGSALTDAAWVVVYFTYDAESNNLSTRISLENQIFNNYAALTYA